MIVMTLLFVAGVIAGIILTTFALLEFIRHESKRLRRTDARGLPDVADDNTVSLAGYASRRDSRGHRPSTRIA